MSARKIQGEIEARECIAKAKKSGLTLAQWARSVGIDGRSLRAWNMNLSRGASNSSHKTRQALAVRGVNLVELVPMAATSRAARYLVQVGQLALEVDAQFDEATLRRLIAVLRSC